jgi:Flp pilus assembly protein TadG
MLLIGPERIVRPRWTAKSNELRRRLRRLCNQAEGQCGSALVEMAFIFPLVVFLMMGIFSFSLLLFQQIQLSEAVSNAGRTITVSRLVTGDPCQSAISSLESTPGFPLNSLKVTVTLGGTSTTSCSSTGSNQLASGEALTVSATYPTSLAIVGKGISAFNLNAQVQEVVQ